MTEPLKPTAGTVNRIFGDALPEVADGERDPESPSEAVRHEQWLRDNVPPHHE